MYIGEERARHARLYVTNRKREMELQTSLQGKQMEAEDDRHRAILETERRSKMNELSKLRNEGTLRELEGRGY